MKVLIVEDDHANAFVARVYLETFGFDCEVAEDGTQALEKICITVYDAVLMDVGMKNLDGYQTTRAIRRYEKEYNREPVAIIGVTGYAFTTDRQKCFEAGMNDYLSKPYNPEDLRVKLRQMQAQA